ncbi:MAG: hypothetical protein D6768_09700 [Chloroflexi bacterium]|nr:MAG: hypothetical protein D6768_09700 [Chloroflexota bacterium]
MNSRHHLNITPPLPGGIGINTLLAAAMVSRETADLLLVDPLAAARQGYGGDPISLTPAEVHLLLSAHGAATLPELCRRIVSLARPA